MSAFFLFFDDRSNKVSGTYVVRRTLTDQQKSTESLRSASIYLSQNTRYRDDALILLRTSARQTRDVSLLRIAYDRVYARARFIIIIVAIRPPSISTSYSNVRNPCANVTKHTAAAARKRRENGADDNIIVVFVYAPTID